MATTKSDLNQSSYSGPPEVRQWHTMDARRDASPVVLRRKFAAVRTRHRRLAEAEEEIRAFKALPAEKQSRKRLEHLVSRRDNAKAWLDFTVATLEQHIRFATSRYDGTLDAVHQQSNIRPRRHYDNSDAMRLVDYYRETLEEFKLAAAISAGSWTRTVCSAAKHGQCDEYKSGKTTMKRNGKTVVACRHILADASRQPIGGHAATDDAVRAMIAKSKPVIDAVTRASGREPEVAEQLAWIELLETAARYDPAASNMARFNTYYTYRARRATQIRVVNDCPPGKTRIKGRIIAYGSLAPLDEDSDSSCFHPASFDRQVDETSLREAVSEALSSLSDEERLVASNYLMGDIGLRQYADEQNLSLHQVRKLVARVTQKLRRALKSYSS